jgi:uncharacterized protein
MPTVPLEKLRLQLADPLAYIGTTDGSVHPIENRTYRHDLIDFGAVGEKEVWQNVKYALLTTYYSVPLDREFGIDATFVDKPIPVAQVVLSQEIALKIGLYEPRARFEDVSFDGDGLLGKLEPTVIISIDIASYLPPMGGVSIIPKKAMLPTEAYAIYTEGEDGSLVPWIKGPQGEPGPPGPRGTLWFTGPNDPIDPIPNSLPGDMYLNTTTGDIFQVTG